MASMRRKKRFEGKRRKMDMAGSRRKERIARVGAKKERIPGGRETTMGDGQRAEGEKWAYMASRKVEDEAENEYRGV